MSDGRARYVRTGDWGGHSEAAGLGCARLLALLLALMFVVLALLALFGATLAVTITDREAVKQAVDAETLAQEVAPALLARIDLQRAGAAELAQIDVAPLQAAARQLVSPLWVQAQADHVVDAVFGYLETGDPAAAEVTIDMRPLLTQLRGDEGRAIVRTGLEALPPCAEPNPTSAPGDGPVILDCRPTGVPTELLVQQVHAVVAQRADAALAAGGVLHVPLVDARTLTPVQRQDLQQIRRLYLLARYRARLLWLAPASALLLIALLTVRSRSELGRWWGWPLVAAGGMGLAAALLVLGWTWFAEHPLPARVLPAGGMAGFVEHFLVTLSRVWLQKAAVQAVVLLGLGMVLLGVGKMSGAGGRGSSGVAVRQPDA